ncbi:MAG TPA: hypothetical protein VGG48_14125 [Rhizomicrobium sp.]|jgi:SOS-response transcriptional repressor LexA
MTLACPNCNHPITLTKAPREKLGLTILQARALNFIRDHIREHGSSPSFDEIRVAIRRKSKSRVYAIVHALQERGHIVLSKSPRSIALVEERT